MAVLMGTFGQGEEQPNILWIVTDDHRADSIRAFNKAERGKGWSELGYVSSPVADQLAKEGVLFTRAYCNSPGCAPSRTSMMYGQYPHRSGQYGFEQSHRSLDISKKTTSELMQELGYRTAQFGKNGIAIFERTELPSGKIRMVKNKLFETEVGQKELYANDRTDWYKQQKWGGGKMMGTEFFWNMPEEPVRLLFPPEGKSPAELVAKQTEVDEKLDLLYSYTRENPSLVIGGVSPQPTSGTQDGQITAAFRQFLQNPGKEYETPWKRKVQGPATDQPLFVNLSYHFPHTPVLPSREFREKFADKEYRVPDFSKEELKRLPPQLQTWFTKTNFADMKAEDKQQAIRDYFAFCAMGDSLIGEAVEEFKKFSKKSGREYLILYVVGDHGWHLGEQGGESKFGPYDTSNHCAVIAVSSDKGKWPAGKVARDWVEFVDFAPTFLKTGGATLSDDSYQHLDGLPLDGVLSGEHKRDYVIGEMVHVIGPRCYLRCDDFAFSMRHREKNGKPGEKWGHPPGEGVEWALEAPVEAVELALFDLRVDVKEQHNLASEPEYQKLAEWFRQKLGRIILGDGRLEADWSQESSYHVSNFAKGAHDRKLEVPAEIIPAITEEKVAPVETPVPSKKSTSRSLERPNIVLLFTDDISARELPLYGSSVWSSPLGKNSKDPVFRAQTPVLDRLAEEGCWVKTAWAATVCSPSRAMMMAGRYAHLHKWWQNKDIGTWTDEKGKTGKWPLYESCPLQLGHVAQQAGYGTYWSGKTQMVGDLRRFGFDEGCFTPGTLMDRDNPYTDFKHTQKKGPDGPVVYNVDTGEVADTYWQHGWYFYPHVRLMHPKGSKKDLEWWPNTDESRKNFGLHTYGPDVELDHIFDYMERQAAEEKPFFVYHTSHLGHDAFDWLNPESLSKWPGTPVVKWTGEGYERTEPKITGDEGVYDTHGTVTESGIHHHVNYLDYQVWLYLQKFEELGIADNTVFIFCSDNGTSGYGKASGDRQKGTHVPFIVSAPGLTKQGEQDVLVNLSDMLPTLVELTGATLPEDYEINGESLVPFLFGEEKKHRDWIYAYRNGNQLIRGERVLMDAADKWWDVSEEPGDLISFPQIKDWQLVSKEHRAERDRLKKILPRFDNYETEHDAPQQVEQ